MRVNRAQQRRQRRTWERENAFPSARERESIGGLCWATVTAAAAGEGGGGGSSSAGSAENAGDVMTMVVKELMLMVVVVTVVTLDGGTQTTVPGQCLTSLT